MAGPFNIKLFRGVTFEAEDGGELRITYDNRGEPYREGLTFSFISRDLQYTECSVFLNAFEVKAFVTALLQAANVDLVKPKEDTDSASSR